MLQNIHFPLQAVLDAQSAQKEQQAWLKENLQTHFARKLIRMVDKIAKFVLPGDGKPEHAFPRLAGSHLSAVSLQSACPLCQNEPKKIHT